MSPRFVLGRENVPCVAEVVNRSLKADCTDFRYGCPTSAKPRSGKTSPKKLMPGQKIVPKNLMTGQVFMTFKVGTSAGGRNQPTTQRADVLLPHLEFVFPHIFFSG